MITHRDAEIVPERDKGTPATHNAIGLASFGRYGAARLEGDHLPLARVRGILRSQNVILL